MWEWPWGLVPKTLSREWSNKRQLSLQLILGRSSDEALPNLFKVKDTGIIVLSELKDSNNIALWGRIRSSGVSCLIYLVRLTTSYRETGLFNLPTLCLSNSELILPSVWHSVLNSNMGPVLYQTNDCCNHGLYISISILWSQTSSTLFPCLCPFSIKYI